MLARDDDEVTVAILNPVTNAPLDMLFVVSGPEGDTRKRAAAQTRREHVDTGTADDEQESDDLHTTALSVLEWSGVRLANGTPAELTRDNAVALFTKAPFIFEQIRSAVHERSVFMRS